MTPPERARGLNSDFTIFGLLAAGLGAAALVVGAGDDFRTNVTAMVLGALAVVIGWAAYDRNDSLPARYLGLAGLVLGGLFWALFAAGRALGWG